MHVFAALALTFKLARTEQFKQLQHQIVKNCVALTDQLKERGFHIPFGGTNTHLTNLDCKSIVGPDGTPLSGDMAARILDVAGLVVNRNTIPGDKTALNASGIRLGTPWMTQRGLEEADMVEVADIIADVLKATTPYTVDTRKGDAQRAKVDFGVLEEAKLKVRAIAEKAGIDYDTERSGYPHFYFLDDAFTDTSGAVAFDLSGVSIRHFMNYSFASDVEALRAGESQKTWLNTPKGAVDGVLTCLDPLHFRLSVPVAQAALAATWLRDLSDGYVAFDPDPVRRLPGPVYVSVSLEKPVREAAGEAIGHQKPYFIGIEEGSGKPLPRFAWEEKEG